MFVLYVAECPGIGWSVRFAVILVIVVVYCFRPPLFATAGAKPALHHSLWRLVWKESFVYLRCCVSVARGAS